MWRPARKQTTRQPCAKYGLCPKKDGQMALGSIGPCSGFILRKAAVGVLASNCEEQIGRWWVPTSSASTFSPTGGSPWCPRQEEKRGISRSLEISIYGNTCRRLQSCNWVPASHPSPLKVGGVGRELAGNEKRNDRPPKKQTHWWFPASEAPSASVPKPGRSFPAEHKQGKGRLLGQEFQDQRGCTQGYFPENEPRSMKFGLEVALRRDEREGGRVAWLSCYEGAHGGVYIAHVVGSARSSAPAVSGRDWFAS